LSNDDGHDAPGIRALERALRTAFDVVLVAPATEQSATSHSLSLHRPLRAVALGDAAFSIDGTPADCVYIALHAGDRFLPRRPDLVMSGINRGLNLGQDVFYSGTVAAAREGALRGLPALAVSAHPAADLARIGALCVRLGQSILSAPKDTETPLLNLNVPEHWDGSVVPARTGKRLYDEVVDVRRDPRGREYIWLGGPGVRHEPEAGTDTQAYDDGKAPLTRLGLHLTARGGSDLCRHLVESL
jgi:5'-nucleotidase